MNCIERSKLTLGPHQKKAIRYFLSKDNDIDGLLLVHPTGTGKTLTAVTASQCYLDKNPNNIVIFVGPSSLITNFKKELKAYGVTNERKYKLYSYQKFLQKEEKERDVICKDNMLIVDEVHNLRNLNLQNKNEGKRSKSVLRCAKYAEKRLLLTATPFVNDLSDFIPIINYLRGKVMVQTKGDTSTVKKIIPYLRDRIHFISVPRESKKEYPKFKEHYIRIKMKKDYQEKYCKIIKGNEVKGDIFRNPESFYNGHRRAVNKIGKGQVYFSEKTKRALRLIGDKKTVIFSNWLDFGLNPIRKVLNENGIKAEKFSGEMSQQEKKKLIEEYNENKFQVLIISKSGMEGIDLKEVRVVIVMDPVWNYSGILQIRGRAIRYKSHEKLPEKERKVDIYYMILETDTENCKSGDTVVYNIIKEKKKNSELVDKMMREVSI
jgi:superfamily II DNA or RNA helicase